MAYTTADLASVRAAISSGIQEVTYADGRKVRYQSLDQLLAAEKVVEAAIRMQSTSASSLVRRRVPYYRSGL